MPTNVLYIPAENDLNRPKRGWYTMHQLSSITTGALIFLSGGMNMALGWEWSQYSSSGTVDHFHYSWFIAVIIGTILSVPLRNIVPKKFLMAISSLLILAGGAIFISTPNTIDGLVAARYLNGIAVGLATMPFLKHASEISRHSSRGACLAIEQYALTFGIAIQMIYTSQWDPKSAFPANRLHGILDILFAILAIGSLYNFVESPVDYLGMGDEASALDSLARLQRPPGITVATNTLLDEHTAYVRLEENYTMMECLGYSTFPLVKMILFRSMMLAFTYSLPLNAALQYSARVNSHAWPHVLAACLRIVGGFMALIIVDKLGRKLTSLISAFIIGAVLIAIAAMLSTSPNLQKPYEMSVVMSLCLVVHFFAGLFNPFTSAYIGEAFPLKVKPHMMALCVIIEQIIRIIVTCSSSFSGNSGMFMAQGITILVVFACLTVKMPETKRTSLKEAQERFRNFFYMNLF